MAAPTSTPQAKDSSDTPADAEPTIPPYETDLDLSAEETEAVEGALVALDGYVETLNLVFASGGSNTELIGKFARDDALKALGEDSKTLRKQEQYMAGQFSLQSRTIRKVAANDNQVSILSCVNNTAFAQVDRGEKLPEADPEPLTVVFVAKSESGTWKVQSQDLWSKNCDN